MPSPKPNNQSPKTPLVEPIRSKLGPVMASLPQRLLPAGKVAVANATVAVRKKPYWWVWLIIAILILASAAYWYFGVYRAEDDVATIPPASYQLIPRTSTLPSGEFTIRNQAVEVAFTNLDSAPPDTHYSLALIQRGEQEISTQLLEANYFDLGSFDIDENGELLFPQAQDGFPQVRPGEQDTILLLISNQTSSAILLAGDISVADDAGVVSATLTFPYQFGNTLATASISPTTDGTLATTDLRFSSLPDVSKLGLKYEARYVHFAGPVVGSELILGRFDAATISPSTKASFGGQNTTLYSDLVISLEPAWDNNPDISQIKPFSAFLE